jgi:hypothetical protein
MLKSLLLTSLILLLSVVEISAQNRKSVGASEVNGTFRSYFDGKFKDNYNEIKILALGRGKLRVALGLTYPYIDGTGGLMANTGEADGEATFPLGRRTKLCGCCLSRLTCNCRTSGRE